MECIVIGVTGGISFGMSLFTIRVKDKFKDIIFVIYHENYYKCWDKIRFK